MKGSKKVTIKDVAREAGVSIATVSYVLNNRTDQSISEETRKKVLQFANLLGYECNFMARYLATGKTNSVTAVLASFPPFSSQYYMQFLIELSRVLKSHGYNLKIADSRDAVGRDCDAYIMIAASLDEFRAFADTQYVPVIAVDTVFDDFLFYRINDDYAALAASVGGNKKGLLTYRLPEQTLADARAHFNTVAVVNGVRDLDLDSDTNYVTVSRELFELCGADNVRLQNASYALKAAAAVESTLNAIDRLQANSAEHDIRV